MLSLSTVQCPLFCKYSPNLAAIWQKGTPGERKIDLFSIRKELKLCQPILQFSASNTCLKLQNSTPPDPWLLAVWRRTKHSLQIFFSSSNLHFVLLSCQTTTRKRTSRKEYFYGRLCWFWKHLGMDIRLLLHETKKCPEGFVVNFFSICWPRQCNLTIWQNQEQDHSNVGTDTPLFQEKIHIFQQKSFHWVVTQ